MREWFEWMGADALDGCRDAVRHHLPMRDVGRYIVDGDLQAVWPLPNVWLGTSVENQDAADERIPELLRTPAAIRFLSCEPLLGPVVLGDALTCEHVNYEQAEIIGWVIVGCESGPGARECKVEWLRSLRDQCAAAGVPYFLKQATFDCDVDGHGIHDGDGSKFKGPRVGRRSPSGRANELIELPYLDGVQHAAFPT